MATQAHLDVVKQGVEAWNTWRMAEPSVRPDLSGVDLRSKTLRRINLRDCNLSGSDLRDSSFRHADLSYARLDGARIYRAYISDARLDVTSFKGTVLYETVFGNVNLSTAKHLATCIHKGPSILDHRTIAKSGGLPLEFVRGCGLPDSIIDELSGPRRQRPSYCSCFISYSSKDQDFANRLYDDLQANGVRCWFAPKDIPIGAKFRDAIDEGIREKEKVLLILSEQSVSSSWVEKEVETAFEEETRRSELILFPIRLDEAVMSAAKSWAADIKRVRHIGDFSGWRNRNTYKRVFSGLLRDLQRPVGTRLTGRSRLDRRG
jgi:uncharacterized protein YjbI with pentapeptide repeats